jgi:hypothetical protein
MEVLWYFFFFWIGMIERGQTWVSWRKILNLRLDEAGAGTNGGKVMVLQEHSRRTWMIAGMLMLWGVGDDCGQNEWAMLSGVGDDWQNEF